MTSSSAPAPEPESTETTIRPEYLIRAKPRKNRTITERISDVLAATFGRQPSASPSSPSSTSNPSHAVSTIVSNITLEDIQKAKRCGGGGFGSVRIVEHPTGAKVALKQLHVAGAQQDVDIRRRTLREGETWQDLKYTHLYLVSPFVKNGALDTYLRQNPNADRQQFLYETAGAISYLHEHGIVHGDIKPSNILVSDDVHALLCDFGLAKSEDGTTSVGLQGVGTVRFQSPEVLTQGEGKTFESDVWAFGMTIHEVLNGDAPFHQYGMATAVIAAVVLRDERPPALPSYSASGVPYGRAWNVARGCWEKDPALRPIIQFVHWRLRPNGKTLRGHSHGVSCLAFSRDGTTIVSGSNDCTLRLWDLASGQQRGEALKGHTGQVECLAFSPDGMTIASGTMDRTLRFWDAASGSQREEAFEASRAHVKFLAFSPDGMAIVSNTYDNTLQLWDVTSGNKKGGALSHTERFSCVAFSPDGSTIVSGSYDNTLRLWDVASGSQKGETLKGHTGLINDLAFSPDGTTIASGSNDCTLRLWDVASGHQRGMALKGHTGGVQCLAFSPDNTTLASGSDDLTLQLWDVASGSHRGDAWRGHKGVVTCLAFSPDGTVIASGSADSTLRI